MTCSSLYFVLAAVYLLVLQAQREQEVMQLPLLLEFLCALEKAHTFLFGC